SFSYSDNPPTRRGGWRPWRGELGGRHRSQEARRSTSGRRPRDPGTGTGGRAGRPAGGTAGGRGRREGGLGRPGAGRGGAAPRGLAAGRRRGAYTWAAYDLALARFLLGRALKEAGDAEAAPGVLHDARARLEGLAGTSGGAGMALAALAETGDCLRDPRPPRGGRPGRRGGVD